MRRAVLLLMLALPGCLLGRNLYQADASIETEVNASQPEAGVDTDGGAETEGGPVAEGEARGPGPAEPPSADAGTDAARADSGRDAGPPALACVPGGAVEREPNDTSPAAEAMKLGVTCGELASATDNDWFTFDSGDDQGGVVALSFKADADARVRIQSGILSFEVLSGNALSIPSDGRWLARVFSPSGQAQKYTITRPAR